MKIWAIGDLHLSFGVPNKTMTIFGTDWDRHEERVEHNWRQLVGDDDLVLIPGDISWATYLDDALPDLEWIDRLPGKKAMIRGNHDYWWSSPTKIRKAIPPSIEVIQNNAILWNDIAIGGARLWDCPEVHFKKEIVYTENPAISSEPRDEEKAQKEAAKIYERELNRLELSLKALDPSAKTRIVMTHFPPVSSKMEWSRARDLLEQYKVDIVVFGHLHNARKDLPLFGTQNNIRYLLTSADYIDCKPIQVMQCS